MNKLNGNIIETQQSGAILLVDVDVYGQTFSALLIESAIKPEWLSIGNSINLVFKESEVSIAKNFLGQISMRNKIECTIVSINKGELLSTIELNFRNNTIFSLITTRSVDALELAINDKVLALVKSNEVSLMK